MTGCVGSPSDTAAVEHDRCCVGMAGCVMDKAYDRFTRG